MYIEPNAVKITNEDCTFQSRVVTLTNREIFKPITKRSNCDRVITFDSHLKTTILPRCRRLLKSVTSRVSIPSTMEASVSTLKLGGHTKLKPVSEAETKHNASHINAALLAASHTLPLKMVSNFTFEK